MFKPLRILGSLSSWCCLIYKVLFAFRLFSRSPVILGSARLFVVVPCYLTTRSFVCQALFSSFFAASRPRKPLILKAFHSFFRGRRSLRATRLSYHVSAPLSSTFFTRFSYSLFVFRRSLETALTEYQTFRPLSTAFSHLFKKVRRALSLRT